MNIQGIIWIIIVFGGIAYMLTTKFIDPKQIIMKNNNKPLPGDYFECYSEAKSINPINGKTWLETYEEDLKEWRERNQ